MKTNKIMILLLISVLLEKCLIYKIVANYETYKTKSGIIFKLNLHFIHKGKHSFEENFIA